MFSVLAVKLFRFTCEPPMKAMPLLLTRITFACWPAPWLMLPAMTLGLASQMRFRLVKLAPGTNWLSLRLLTWRNCTLAPALTLNRSQFRIALLPTWLMSACLPLTW